MVSLGASMSGRKEKGKDLFFHPMVTTQGSAMQAVTGSVFPCIKISPLHYISCRSVGGKYLNIVNLVCRRVGGVIPTVWQDGPLY